MKPLSNFSARWIWWVNCGLTQGVHVSRCLSFESNTFVPSSSQHFTPKSYTHIFPLRNANKLGVIIYISSYIIDLVLSGEGRPFHPSIPSSVPSSKFLIPGWRRWWNGRTTTTHRGGRRLSTWSCDPISAVCLSTSKLFLCGLQEFSRASDGGPATTETKWRHKEKRYKSKAAEEGRHLLSIFLFFFGICPLKWKRALICILRNWIQKWRCEPDVNQHQHLSGRGGRRRRMAAATILSKCDQPSLLASLLVVRSLGRCERWQPPVLAFP